MMTRFVVSNNALSTARNRGYDDGLAGKPAAPSEQYDDKTRSAYWQGWRNGDRERREHEQHRRD